MGKNPFDEEFTPEIETKESSFSQPGTNFPHEKYKTIRIRPSDYKALKIFAFEQDMTMVEAVSLAINMLGKNQARKDK